MYPKVSSILIFFLLQVIPLRVSAATPDWTLYSHILEKYVNREVHSGIPVNWVDYSGLKQEPDFNKLVKSIETFPTEHLDGKAESLSFYINAYNILAIKMVLDHWPVSSIKDAGSWLKPVWDKAAGKINGNEITLGMIEHEILRPMDEPRIHMAIVCASLSCPDLRREAYHAEILEEQLEDQTRQFLNNSAKGLRFENGKIITSRIFDWFREDFTGNDGIRTFIRKYVAIPDDIDLKATMPYNWNLNGD